MREPVLSAHMGDMKTSTKHAVPTLKYVPGVIPADVVVAGDTA